tara:strand:- start:690 stop:1058 length:369 start_codon:yes stop_codon:yes gene_type:complete
MATKKDACYKKVKRSYKKFPSARASQAIAKCRKGKGKVRKTKKGAALKRWSKEKWVNTKTGKPCGHKGASKAQYCRPSKRVSKKTPKTTKQVSAATKRKQQARKASGRRAKPLRKRRTTKKK